MICIKNIKILQYKFISAINMFVFAKLIEIRLMSIVPFQII